ncbi:MAG TPA: gamma-aminobutyraldehyde dehydrogenase, partial [Arthrobacter bacterium]|nr:gamma-aminobutyraldehyde dehydrogenase [Arthrobacter sp.]
AIAEFAFFNAGQDCTAITRVLVEDSVHDDVVAAMVEHTATLHTGSQNDEENYFGPLNNVNHFNAVTSVVEHLPENCRIVTGGHRAGVKGFFFEPTIVTGAQQTDDIVQ